MSRKAAFASVRLLPVTAACDYEKQRVLYYISNVSVLFLYGVITLLFTTIVDRFYIKLPFAFAIPAGIGMIMWYCRDILQKKGKHGTGNKKT